MLARLKLPLTTVMTLSAGMLLTLPQAGLDRISLEGLDGRRVAQGRLGQNRGLRAVRLSEAALVGGEVAEARLQAGDGLDIGAAEGFDGLSDLDAIYQATGTD